MALSPEHQKLLDAAKERRLAREAADRANGIMPADPLMDLLPGAGFLPQSIIDREKAAGGIRQESLDRMRSKPPKLGKLPRRKKDKPKHSCMQCGTETPKQKFCNRECQHAWLAERHLLRSPDLYPELSNAELSAVCVHAAISDLLARGYRVKLDMVQSTLLTIEKGSRKLTVTVRAGEVGNRGDLVAAFRGGAAGDVLAIVCDGFVEYTPELPPLTKGAL